MQYNNAMMNSEELQVIQHVHDLCLWYAPRLNKLPGDFKHALGDRIQSQLQSALKNLIRARYAGEKLPVYEALRDEMEMVRYRTRLCRDLNLLNARRYAHANRLLNDINDGLGRLVRGLRDRPLPSASHDWPCNGWEAAVGQKTTTGGSRRSAQGVCGRSGGARPAGGISGERREGVLASQRSTVP